MSTTTFNDRDPRAGYSLVEVTLALLVVAIGLTATFALFPEGLKATRAAVDDTETSMFSEYVFTTLELTAGLKGSAWTIDDARLFKSAALAGDISDARFKLVTDQQAVFYWIPDFYGIGAGGFAAANFKDFWTSAFTYTLTVEESKFKGLDNLGVTKYAVLKVWPGDKSGQTLKDADARVFYREILPFR